MQVQISPHMEELHTHTCTHTERCRLHPSSLCVFYISTHTTIQHTICINRCACTMHGLACISRSTLHPPSFIHHPAAKDEVTPTQSAGARAASRAAGPPLSATHRPDVAVRSRPQLAQSASILSSVTATPFPNAPTSQTNRQPRARPPACGAIIICPFFVCVSSNQSPRARRSGGVKRARPSLKSRLHPATSAG